MWKDPIGLKIEADCGNNFDKIFAQAIKIQEKMAARVVSKPAHQQSTETISEIR